MKEKLHDLLKKPETELGRARRRIAVQVGAIVLVSLTVCAILFGLTSAWYTNIVKQNQITVQTASWGVDVTVTYSDPGEGDHYALQKDGSGAVTGVTFTDVYPGSSGTIPFTITNNSDSLDAKVRLDLTRLDWPEQMLQRLYFTYTDPQSGQTTYFTAENAPVWTVAKGDSVDASIGWAWVEDVLGYYFTGSVTMRVTNDNGTERKTFTQTAEEYLEPFAYDTSRVTYGENGLPETINEDRLLVYLYNFHATNTDASWIDNKANDIHDPDLTPFFYWPEYHVQAGDTTTNGTISETVYTGKFLHICTLGEIAAATGYDTRLGTDAQEALNDTDENTVPQAFSVNLTFTGEVSG